MIQKGRASATEEDDDERSHGSEADHHIARSEEAPKRLTYRRLARENRERSDSLEFAGEGRCLFFPTWRTCRYICARACMYGGHV